MDKNMRNWLVAGGAAAAGAGVLVLSTWAATAYMVRMAMDRQSPGVEHRIAKLSGNPDNAALMAVADALGQRLEASECETVELRSHDGLRLVGHWRPCPEPKRIIVAMHGWRSRWSRDFGLIADFWYANGCSVLYAEQRGQGESGGEYMGFGMLERHDCKRWACWAAERQPELPIYLAGISMGAATVLMAGGMDLPPQVHGILADCGFTSAHDIWQHVARRNLHLHYGLYAATARDMCRKKIRVGPQDWSTLDAMAECEVPVLFVHGTDDSFVPIEMTYANYKACAAPKRLLVVPGAGHGLSYYTDRSRYENALLDFFQEFDENR